jgi:hypothetical protein
MTLCYLVFELLLGKRSELVSVFVDVYVTHCLSVFLVAGFAMGKIIYSENWGSGFIFFHL